MITEFTQKALAVFREVCERSESERTAFLDTACGDDAAVREMVETMLRYDSDADEPDARHPMRAVLADLADRAETDGAAPAPLPADIGGYRVTRFIARGGMGDVYEGRQENPDRRVAIKVARTAGMTGEARRRFELEAQLLARLSHPRIAQIIEAGTTGADSGSQPFFVMEFVEGLSLTDHAAAHLPDARARLELMVALCETIGFAHRQGVIHRDLKPENVLIDSGGAPKVLDFGVAKVESAGGFGLATMRTEAGRVVGTLGYMAPEQLAGTTVDLGPEADVYSLGVMIYELLSGRLPHELDAATLTRALAVVTTTDAPLLGVIRPEHRGDIEAVVAKALEKDRRHRYPDATALQQDLERFLRGEPTLARPAGPLRRFAKWTRRNPALATAVFGLFVLLTSTAAILMVSNQERQKLIGEYATVLDDYGRLEDARRLEQAVAAANVVAGEAAVWPTRPEQIPALERWIDTYRPLVDPERIRDHQAAAERLGAQDGPLAPEPIRWQHAMLVQLVQDMTAFAAQGGLFGQVQARWQLAEIIADRTVDVWRADWGAARQRILEDARYHGLSLEPQVGLVPLGPDPESGLEEFLHFETHEGEIPRRDAAGDLPAVTRHTGLILVLLPGGTFWMGCQSHDRLGPNYDELAIAGGSWPVEQRRADDRGLHREFWEHLYEATVAPFLLSKYEMTQGQWQRFVGSNPSLWLSPPRGHAILAHPVNQVSWARCTEVLRRLGLVLPHEQQWEYAARAGTTTAWWPGQHARDLAGAESLFEQAAALHFAPWWPAKAGVQTAPWFEPWKFLFRGDAVAAPVGSYRANGFGLYDVAGNVSEWCANRPGDLPGYCLPLFEESEVPIRMIRGGNFKRGVTEARSAFRIDIPLVFVSEEIGLRPAMALQR